MAHKGSGGAFLQLPDFYAFDFRTWKPPRPQCSVNIPAHPTSTLQHHCSGRALPCLHTPCVLKFRSNPTLKSPNWHPYNCMHRLHTLIRAHELLFVSGVRLTGVRPSWSACSVCTAAPAKRSDAPNCTISLRVHANQSQHVLEVKAAKQSAPCMLMCTAEQPNRMQTIQLSATAA